MLRALPPGGGRDESGVPVLDASTGGTVKMDALGPIVGTFLIAKAPTFLTRFFLRATTDRRVLNRTTTDGEPERRRSE